VLNVFEPTIREMRSILHVYEEKLATAQGRSTLYPTDLTRHFLTSRATPSDIRMKISLIETQLAKLGFNTRDLPTHVAQYTLDEKKLGEFLGDDPTQAGSRRVVHDVDCVAGVLTHRRGHASDSWDTARAVFVSSNSRTIDSVIRWYRDQGGKGLPPIVHSLYLSNLAWLKKPASAATLKVNELLALCAAALRPSRATWNRFLGHLRSLEASGALESDEVTAILANGLVEGILIDAGVDEDSDAATLGEVIDRVKETYRREATAEVAAARREALDRKADATRVQATVQSRARTIGRGISWLLAGLMGGSFAVGTGISIDTAVGGSAPGLPFILLAAVPLALAGLLGLISGFNLRSWQMAVEERVSRLLAGWLLGSP
jgi:hypothetical protein